jgi:hypothetical protein
MSERPRYRDLPDGNAKGVYGEDDWFGCLNELTPERSVAASRLVQTGEVFNLNAPLKEFPKPNPAGRDLRPVPTHHIYELLPGIVYDDYLDGLYPQSGTQWDGFLHVRDPKTLEFYNGRTELDLGIEMWARRGIVGRGVLLDIERWFAGDGRPLEWTSGTPIQPADLKACAAAQGVSVDTGTILLVRVGWETGYGKLSEQERWDFAAETWEERIPQPGLAGKAEMAELLWDWGVAAVAADNQAVEVVPAFGGLEDGLHVLALARLGLPFGEFFLLDELASACDAQKRYEFLFTSAPMNLTGGIGSTGNALAIL